MGYSIFLKYRNAKWLRPDMKAGVFLVCLLCNLLCTQSVLGAVWYVDNSLTHSANDGRSGSGANRTSAPLDSGNPIGRKLKASHLADESVAAVEPGGIAHRCFKTSFVENMQFGTAIEALDLQALSFA